jgi:hypothetical protein
VFFRKERKMNEYKITFIRVLSILMFILFFSKLALAIPLQIIGQYNGEINGEPIIATAAGDIDTSGANLNHFELEFKSRPNDFNPFFAGNCWKSSYWPSACLPTGGAVNLFGLSGGSYFAGRTVRWDSLPDDEFTLTADVSTANGIMYANTIVNGTYRGPTDLIGISNYQMVWTQLTPSSIEVKSTATILRANGDSFNANITSVYSGLTAQMPSYQQTGTIIDSYQLFNNNILYDYWQGTIVPEPVTVLLLGLGGLILRNRNHRFHRLR